MKKEFLFIYRSFKHKLEMKSKILESVNNNYCNYDFGFFLLSLKCIANVDFIMGVEEFNGYREKKYDAIFIDVKALETREDCLFLRKTNISIYLFSANDQQIKNNKFFIEEDLINLLEPKLIYSLNLFKDYSIYQLSLNNLDKLRETFYALGFLNVKYDLKNYSFQNFKLLPKINDIFFSGNSLVNPARKEILKFVNKNFLDLKKNIKFNSILDRDEYINSILQSKINLALPGNYYNISYRHYEIFFLKSLLLTDSSFKKYKVSKYFSQLDSFVFNDVTGLVNLVYYYTHFNEDREKTISKLNEQFMDFYCPKKQGEKIYNDLFC